MASHHQHRYERLAPARGDAEFFRLAPDLDASLMTGLSGASAALPGGRLMGGGLAALAAQLPSARLELDQIGGLFGDATLGPVSPFVTAGLKGAVFDAAMVLALAVELRQWPGGLQNGVDAG